jgi:anti-sigma factor RsiW
MVETLCCEEALELIEPCLDGELSRDEEVRFRAHLRVCVQCSGELLLAQRILLELRQLRTSQTSKVVPLAAPIRRTGLPRPARGLLAAAMLALTVGSALYLAQSRVPPAPQPDAAEVARATREARFALAYVGKVSRRTGLELRNGLMVGHRPSSSDLGPAAP